MKKSFSFFFIFFLPFSLLAQINESDTLKWKANLSLTGLWQGGNVETLIFRVKAVSSFKPTDKWLFITQNSYVYQEFGKQKADEDILSLNFLYFNPEQKIYPLLLGFVSTNYRRNIDLRYLLGTGVTYHILNNKKDWLKLSISSEFEQTDFGSSTFNRTKYNTSKSIQTFRGTIWINGNYHLFENKVIAKHEIYFQPSIEQRDNFRWQANLGLEFPIWEFLNIKIDYLHTFESIVIENQKQEDSFLTFGFTLKSY